MVETNFTKESADILHYIKDKLIIDYPTNKITIEYFLLAVMKHENSIAYEILSRSTLNSTLENLKEWLSKFLLNKKQIKNNNESVSYDTIYDRCIEYANKTFSTDVISSGHMLLSIVNQSDIVNKYFKKIGITYEQLLTNLNSMSPNNADVVKDNNLSKLQSQQIQAGPVEELLIDINKQALNNKIDEVIGNEDVISNVFNILSKRDKNNVVIVGDSGIGKTATVLHIANLINRGDVPEAFKNKKLMKMDFTQLVSGSAFRGNFEAKFNSIISDAIIKNGYIFFIDDIQSILTDKSKFGEVSIENMLDMILMEKNIQFICTTDTHSYSAYIQSNPSLRRRFQKVEMREKSDDEIIKILETRKTVYEKYHNVKYDDNSIKVCVNLIRRYVKDAKLPDYAFDILDEIGAKINNNKTENKQIIKYKTQLEVIKNKIALVDSNTTKNDFDEYDKLKKKEISIKTKISIIEKEDMLNNKPFVVTDDDVMDILSKKTNIPLEKLTINDYENLKKLSENIKRYVIGQDEAVDEVCRVVKRQRIGLSDNNRPSVLFFAGLTGTGKTYLAKKLAQEVFGDEKNMVRLDMSEYSDSMSVTKLYGSASGYVGYDKGGILTEEIKKNNHCVLLLDEMEKASNEVHNVFLQLFDDGRLTDNMGVTVDFSNVIVIMTSNVGAKEITNKGNNIGFIQENDDNKKEIIEKAIKSKFSPEFINRIDKIVFFNKLNESNIKLIILKELYNLNKKIINIGYSLDNEFFSDEYVNKIYEKIKDRMEYGARPILHIIRHDMEDKLIDYIIDNQPNKGFMFTTNMV